MMHISKSFVSAFFAIFLISILGAQNAGCQQYYNGGDINYDGWCNMADLNILVGWFATNCDNQDFCMEGADVDGNGIVNFLDISAMVSFFNGGPGPIGSCPEVTRTCDPTEQAKIWLLPVPNPDPDQATFEVYVEATADIGALNFSYKYDLMEIAFFSTANHANINMVMVKDRFYAGGENIVAFLVLCGTDGNGVNYPMGIGGTRIFDIIINRPPGAPNQMLKIVEDPVHGPPYFYFGAGANCAGEDIICPFTPWLVTGDINLSDSYDGLDISYGVSFFRGGPKPIARCFYNVLVQWDF